MTPLQLELTRLIGKKELTFGCKVIAEWTIRTMVWDADYKNYLTSNGSIEYNYYVYANEDTEFSIDEIIGHPATLSDFHRWIMKTHDFAQSGTYIEIMSGSEIIEIKYDSSKNFLDQDEETLKQIISLIKEQW